MRNPFRFFTELMQQPVWIPVWMFYLMVINLSSVFFWEEFSAKLIVITFLISGILMMGLYSYFGFEKILGLGHILWVPLLFYILSEVSLHESSFKIYLVALSLSIAVSLAFDIADVWKYFVGGGMRKKIAG